MYASTMIVASFWRSNMADKKYCTSFHFKALQISLENKKLSERENFIKINATGISALKGQRLRFLNFDDVTFKQQMSSYGISKTI